MKLAISNIAWRKEDDERMYNFLSEMGIEGLEIAPTRIIEVNPYEHKIAAKAYSTEIKEKYDLNICSMQSIWYGKKEEMFASDEEFKILMEYSKKAIDFAEEIKCENLVFGCPKNRIISSDEDIKKAIEFFYEIGEYAKSKHTCFSLEANPSIYGTNFMNRTEEVIEIVKMTASKGCKINLDVGTMIWNEEDLSIISKNMDLIHHIHISEPHLSLIEKRKLHNDLSCLLRDKYNGYISIEMGYQDNIEKVKEIVRYIKEVFQ